MDRESPPHNTTQRGLLNGLTDGWLLSTFVTIRWYLELRKQGKQQQQNIQQDTLQPFATNIEDEKMDSKDLEEV